MALAYLLDPTNQYQNRAGVNNVHGYFKVYLANTDDLVVTYKDFNGTLNPEQIDIDNNGRCVIIADSSHPYRVEMYEPNGTLVFTQYPVYCIAGGGGSGITAVNIESTNGSIRVDRTDVGSQINFDLSVSEDDPQFLEWAKCEGANSPEAGTLVPIKSDGTMGVNEHGIVLKANQLYHVTARFAATKGDAQPLYDNIALSFNTFNGESSVAVLETNHIVDYSLGLTQEFEISADVKVGRVNVTLFFAYSGKDSDQGEVQFLSADIHKLFSGISQAAGPITQEQADWTEANPAAPSYIKNKPNLATVATSGSYNDLSDKPTIPSVPVQDVQVDGSSVVNAQGVAEITTPTFTQAQADWDQANTSAADYIKNKPNLATVATSGSYSDLSGRPDLAAVATSGLYADLLGKPTIPDAQQPSDWDATTGVTRILNKPSFAEVAYSGAYSDLSGKPTMPTVDQTYSSSSTNAQSGTAVAEAIADSKELPAIANKENLFLQVNSTGTGIQWAGTPKPSFQRFNGTTSSVTIPAGDYASSTVAATLAQTISAGDVFVGDMVLQLADFTGSAAMDAITLGYKAGTAYGSYSFRRLDGQNTYIIPVNIDNQYGNSAMSIGFTISGTVLASTTFDISLNGLLITT